MTKKHTKTFLCSIDDVYVSLLPTEQVRYLPLNVCFYSSHKTSWNETKKESRTKEQIQFFFCSLSLILRNRVFFFFLFWGLFLVFPMESFVDLDEKYLAYLEDFYLGCDIW